MNVTSFGLLLRMVDGFSCEIGYNPLMRAIAVGLSSVTTTWWFVTHDGEGNSTDTVTLHIFLDRSVIEVFTGGAALKGRCLLPSGVFGGIRAAGRMSSFGVDLFAKGGEVELVRLDTSAMETAWKAT